MWVYIKTLGYIILIYIYITIYLNTGKPKDAEKALQWFRGAKTNISTELNEIKDAHMLSQKYKTKMRDLLGKAYVKPLIVSIGLMFFQQFSGVSILK